MHARVSALLEKLEQNNCKATILPIHFLSYLRRDMEDLCEFLNPNLIHRYLNDFHYDSPGLLPNAQSIIIIAIPQPITVFRFIWQKNLKKIIVPPTYVYTDAERVVLSIAETELKQENYSLIRGKLPLKLLAARSGLSQYGRNNISYISGMGSFYRLIALISDLPCDGAVWHDIHMMADCSNCWACLTSCPTKCISRNRTMIDASHCLTYINESPEPFPDWINENWHNSLIGCMRCQLACPQNRSHNLIREYKDTLSESDVAALLHKDNFTQLPNKTRDLLEKLNLTDYELAVLQRNLMALLTN